MKIDGAKLECKIEVINRLLALVGDELAALIPEKSFNNEEEESEPPAKKRGRPPKKRGRPKKDVKDKNPSPSSDSKINPNSRSGKIYQILLDAEEPMSIQEIIIALGENEDDEKCCESIKYLLNKRIKNRDTFVLVGDLYGLKE